jgi:glutathione peroxidase
MFLFALICLAGVAVEPKRVLDHGVPTLEGDTLDMGTPKGKLVLIVNTASECGLTPQLGKLEQLNRAYGKRGLVILGFPSNDFGGQESGSPREIRTFRERNHGVSFPMLAKAHTTGPEKAPVYRFLTERTPAGIKGELAFFCTKFLVDERGEVVVRFEPEVDPQSAELVATIEKRLPR